MRDEGGGRKADMTLVPTLGVGTIEWKLRVARKGASVQLVATRDFGASWAKVPRRKAKEQIGGAAKLPLGQPTLFLLQSPTKSSRHTPCAIAGCRRPAEGNHEKECLSG